MTIDIEDVFAIDESSVTVRGYRHRTTIPSKIFNFLNLKDKDRIRWIILKDKTLIIRKANNI